MSEKYNGGYITEVDDNGEIINTYQNAQHLWDVMHSRYSALQKKREKEISKAFNKGYYFGMGVVVTGLIIFRILTHVL